ncbi:ABC transporter permease [Neolewinella lacunae]|uniref:ABC transporter permease n=1 Tax=Neolewinella lacunae TaxID=1517758 RepID=A0A923PJY8_9BACT|nr:ABC transporter permease [Neolewinella lacunae]MBC6995513.1 ABC transporter permease [Neolewinella lacunae]MDN3635101.1 ABC transporter permease [Neolewinella lacunae]
MLFLKVLNESVRQAWSQLTGNKLRTFLSLLGISIGIFCIIGVLSAVDSLEDNVSGSLAKLGDDVVYIDKWPWKDNSNDWWEFFQRPYPDHDDYEALKEKMPSASLVSYWTVPGSKALKYQSNSVEGGFLFVTTYEMDRLFNITIEKGRYWTNAEYTGGADKMLLGHAISNELFGALEPVGKTVKMGGRKYEVIGVLEAAGGDLINPLDFDDAIMVTYNNAARFINLKNRNQYGGTIGVKAKEGVPTQQLQDDIRGILRSNRRLRPREGDNFALNELSMMADALGSFFGVLNMMGWLIGGFSIIVGAISVANIMFVSVKERTSLIGVKKALGARQFVILLEFLTESVILCIIGGLMGLVLVVGITSIINTSFESFAITLSAKNAILGVVLSAVVGILAGAIPAGQAAAMDPVEAMRS